MIDYISLFSGIGAFERALENLNITYNMLAYCEIDKFASKSYSTLHKISESKNLGDITNVHEKCLSQDIDLVTYGFPCQDISIAGKKKGFVDENDDKTRSGLFFDALRIIKHCKPKIAIGENVKALTYKNMKKEFETLLSSLDDAGYVNQYFLLNATDYGIPQNRERIFIVSIRKDIYSRQLTQPETKALQYCLNDFLDDVVDETYYLTSKQTSKAFEHNISHSGPLFDRNGICTTLLFSDCKHPKIVQAANLNHYKNDMMNRVYSTCSIAPSLTAVSGGGREIKILKNKKYRKLTPLEYMRLMGFTDDDYHMLKSIGISKTQIYKMCGNSIVVPVLEALFKSIMEQDYLVNNDKVYF